MADNTRLVLKRGEKLTLVWRRREYCCPAEMSQYKDLDRVYVLKQDALQIVVGERKGHTERWRLDVMRELDQEEKLEAAVRALLTPLVRDALRAAWRHDQNELDEFMDSWPELRGALDRLE